MCNRYFRRVEVYKSVQFLQNRVGHNHDTWGDQRGLKKRLVPDHASNHNPYIDLEREPNIAIPEPSGERCLQYYLKSCESLQERRTVDEGF